MKSSAAPLEDIVEPLVSAKYLNYNIALLITVLLYGGIWGVSETDLVPLVLQFLFFLAQRSLLSLWKSGQIPNCGLPLHIDVISYSVKEPH